MRTFVSCAVLLLWAVGASAATHIIPCAPNNPAQAFAIGQTAKSGDTVLFADCTYDARPPSTNHATFLITTTNVHYKAQNIGNVVLIGQGYSDEDRDGDGKADGPYACPRPGPNGCKTNQIMIHITGTGNTVEGFVVKESSRRGVWIQGNNNTVLQTVSRDNWMTGFEWTGTGHVLRWNEAWYNRHHTGMQGFTPSNQITVQENLSCANGWQDWTTQVLPISGDPDGGGNADGFGGFKDCDQGGNNICTQWVVKNNVACHNADGDYDFSIGGSLFENNISAFAGSQFHNGKVSGVAYKTLRAASGNHYIGNVGYRARSRCYEPRVLSPGGIWANNSAIACTTDHGFVASGTMEQFVNNLAWGSGKKDYNQVRANDTRKNLSGKGDSPADIIGDPEVINPDFWWDQGASRVNFPVNIENLIPAGTPQERWRWVYDQLAANLQVSNNSMAIDAGVPVSWTNPLTGQSEARCQTGNAVDAGALGDCYRQAPGPGPGPGPTPPPDLVPPGVPTNLRIRKVEAGSQPGAMSLRATWDVPATDANGNSNPVVETYTVCHDDAPIMGHGEQADCTTVVTVPEAEFQCAPSTLVHSHRVNTCYVRVRARNDAGSGDLSAEAPVLVPGPGFVTITVPE